MANDPSPSRDVVVALYGRLLDAWNARDAVSFAHQFTGSGSSVGFDGSQMDGRDAIRSELARIFADHTPARFDGRPELGERLTAELTAVHRNGRVVDPGDT